MPTLGSVVPYSTAQGGVSVGLTRRYLLSSLLKFSDVALLVGSFLAAAVASLHSVGATSLAQFLSLRVSVRTEIARARWRRRYAGVQQQRQGSSEVHTSELQSRGQLVWRLLLEK